VLARIRLAGLRANAAWQAFADVCTGGADTRVGFPVTPTRTPPEGGALVAAVA